MKVDRLTLRNFRNIQECSFNPDPRLNFFIGANGQGKTSIIEALGFLSSLRSFRGSKSHEVVRWNSDESDVSCSISPDTSDQSHWNTDLKVSFSPGVDRKKVSKIAFVNQKPFRSSTQYLSQRFGQYELGFHSIVFNPSDHDLVRGEPANRRSFLDSVVAAEDEDYLKLVVRYRKLLEQRNKLLKMAEKPSKDLLLGFTEPMVRFGAQIVLKRLQWIERVALHLNRIAGTIAPKQPTLRLFYLSNWSPQIEGLSYLNNDLGSIHFAGQGPLPSLEQIEQSFWMRLAVLEQAELKTRSSLVGPHRDDWTFFLGDQPLKGHGSQGEIRTALLALKLTEIDLFRNRTGHRPLLLLDDFSSELDRERRAYLLQYLSKTDLQVFVTTTEDFAFAGKRFFVVNGTLVERVQNSYDQSSEQSSG